MDFSFYGTYFFQISLWKNSLVLNQWNIFLVEFIMYMRCVQKQTYNGVQYIRNKIWQK